jgi:hypothetical protein
MCNGLFSTVMCNEPTKSDPIGRLPSSLRISLSTLLAPRSNLGRAYWLSLMEIVGVVSVLCTITTVLVELMK